jgi:hypothetical protein
MMKKVLKGVVKGVQVVGVGLGAAALTDPVSLSTILPPKYLPPVLAASAIINAFAPGLAQDLKKKKQELGGEDEK